MSEPPSIIRQDTPHEVSVTEGSQVAASRSLDPVGPQVRRTLAGEDLSEDAEGSAGVPVPPALVQASAEEPELPEPLSPQAHAAPDVPPELAQAHGSQEGIVFERSVRSDDFQQVQALPPQVDATEAPVFQRTLEDHRVDLPPPPDAGAVPASIRIEPRLLPDTPEAPAPIARTVPTHRVQLPPREGLGELATPPARVTLPRSMMSRPADNLAPVPVAEAQEQISQAAADVQQRVSETLGSADSGWAEMDFPARVVKLKIENDKVRTKLDQLAASVTRAPR